MPTPEAVQEDVPLRQCGPAAWALCAEVPRPAVHQVSQGMSHRIQEAHIHEHYLFETDFSGAGAHFVSIDIVITTCTCFIVAAGLESLIVLRAQVRAQCRKVGRTQLVSTDPNTMNLNFGLISRHTENFLSLKVIVIIRNFPVNPKLIPNDVHLN